MDFCADYIDQCGDNGANDYVDVDGCGAACSGYDAGELDCKVMHLGFVESMGPSHCAHANMDGGGVC
jgi:hypothetical protein